MTPRQHAFIEFIREEYDINEKIDFFEENQEFNVEIESCGLAVVLDLVGTATIFTEEGGEPDEFLTGIRDKNLYIQEVTYFENEAEHRITDVFKNKIEEVLNEQMYED